MSLSASAMMLLCAACASTPEPVVVEGVVDELHDNGACEADSSAFLTATRYDLDVEDGASASLERAVKVGGFDAASVAAVDRFEIFLGAAPGDEDLAADDALPLGASDARVALAEPFAGGVDQAEGDVSGGSRADRVDDAFHER